MSWFSKRKNNKSRRPKTPVVVDLFSLPAGQFERELEYLAYAHNRQFHTHISIEQWRLIYPHVDELEARFLREHDGNG